MKKIGLGGVERDGRGRGEQWGERCRERRERRIERGRYRWQKRVRLKGRSRECERKKGTARR